MSAGGISAGSVFVSIKADLGPFRAQLGGLQKQVQAMGKSLSTSLSYPQQAGRVAAASSQASAAVETLNARFIGLTGSIAAANRQLATMVGTMKTAGIRFTRMGAAVQAVKSSYTQLSKANPVDPTLLQRIGTMNKGLYYMSRSALRTSNALATIGGVAVAPIIYAGKAYADFELQMRRVQLLTNTTGAEFEALEKTARKLGATTSFTAVEAAQGMRMLAQAGLDANEVLSTIPSVLALAKVGDIGLGEASQILVKVSTSFGLLASDASFVSDVIAKAADSSTSSVSEMAQAFRYVASNAKQMNLSIEDTGALLGALSTSGLKASQSGRLLNQSLIQLVRNRGKLKDLGIAVTDAGTGKIRNYVDILKDFNGVINGLTQEEKLAKIDEIFRTQGGLAARNLLGMIGKLDELRAKVKDNTGYAARLAAELDKTLGGQWKIMVSRITDVAIGLGKQLAPALKEAMRDVVTFATAIAQWIPKNIETIKYIAKLGLTFLEMAIYARSAGYAFSIFNTGGEALGGLLKVAARFGVTWPKVVSGINAIASGSLASMFTRSVAAMSSSLVQFRVNALRVGPAILTAIKPFLVAYAAIEAVSFAWNRWNRYVEDTKGIQEAGSAVTKLQDKMTQLLKVQRELNKTGQTGISYAESLKTEKNVAIRRGQTPEDYLLSIAKKRADIERRIRDIRAGGDPTNTREAKIAELNAKIQEDIRKKNYKNVYSDTKKLEKLKTGAILVETEVERQLRKEQLQELYAYRDAIVIAQDQAKKEWEDTGKVAVDVSADVRDEWVKAYQRIRAELGQLRAEEAKVAMQEMFRVYKEKFTVDIQIDPEQAAEDINTFAEKAQKNVMIYQSALSHIADEMKKLTETRTAGGLEGELAITSKIEAMGKQFDEVSAKLEESKEVLSFWNGLQKEVRAPLISLRKALYAEVVDIQKARQNQLDARTLQDLRKTDPEAALAKARERAAMAEMDQQAKLAELNKAVAEAETLRTEEAIKAAMAAKEQWKTAYDTMVNAQDVVADIEQDFAKSATTSMKQLEAMSLGFRGSDNPLEMLGGAAFKVDQEMLKVNKAQLEVLKEIAAKDTAPKYR